MTLVYLKTGSSAETSPTIYWVRFLQPMPAELIRPRKMGGSEKSPVLFSNWKMPDEGATWGRICQRIRLQEANVSKEFFVTSLTLGCQGQDFKRLRNKINARQCLLGGSEKAGNGCIVRELASKRSARRKYCIRVPFHITSYLWEMPAPDRFWTAPQLFLYWRDHQEYPGEHKD